METQFCPFFRPYQETQAAIRVGQYVVKYSQILGINVVLDYYLFGTVHPVEQAR